MLGLHKPRCAARGAHALVFAYLMVSLLPSVSVLLINLLIVLSKMYLYLLLAICLSSHNVSGRPFAPSDRLRKLWPASEVGAGGRMGGRVGTVCWLMTLTFVSSGGIACIARQCSQQTFVVVAHTGSDAPATMRPIGPSGGAPDAMLCRNDGGEQCSPRERLQNDCEEHAFLTLRTSSMRCKQSASLLLH